MKKILLTVSISLWLTGTVHAVETPFTPFKDGHADASTVSGVARTLVVRAGDSKAWVIHPLADGSTSGLLKARLSVYVKDIRKDGTLRAYLATPFRTPEANTPLHQLKNASTEAVGSAAFKANDNIQGMVSISLDTNFLKAVKAGNYAGILLEGADGLDAELGAIEGGHGALLYLDFAAGSTIDAAVIDSVAAVVVAKHKDELQGASGSKGDKGDQGIQGIPGLPGLPGAAGAKGDKGDKGDKGEPGPAADQAPIFQLLVDRGARAQYNFNNFGSAVPRTTPDSSGNGNTLTLSEDGASRREIAAGDSSIQFTSDGYATAPNSLSLNPYKEITLSARVQLTAGTLLDTQMVISKKNQYEMAIIKDGLNAVLKVRFKTALVDGGWIGGGLVSTSDVAWTKVEAAYDGKVVRTFINGVQTSYTNFAYGPLAMDATPLFIGARETGTPKLGLRGTLDDVKILSYSVSAQDSVGTLPGKVNSTQLVLDSIPTLRTTLDARTNVTVVDFSGQLGVSSNNTVTYADITNSARNISFPVGTYAFHLNWSCSYYVSAIGTETQIRPVLYTTTGVAPFLGGLGPIMYSNEPSSHRSISGSWATIGGATILPGGIFQLRFQLRRAGTVAGTISTDAGDYCAGAFSFYHR